MEPEYTNGRIRVRPDQIEYLEALLHKVWVELSRERARTKEVIETQPDELFKTIDAALITHMNRELRLIKSIQDEIKRTKEDMNLA